MRWIDRSREPIVGHQRHAVRLVFRELRVRRDHADGGVFAGLGRRDQRARSQELARVGKGPIGIQHAGDHFPRRRIDDVADAVHRDDRCDDEAVRHANGRRPDARLHRAPRTARITGVLEEPAQLADGCACACADAALGDRSARGRRGGFVAAVCRRADLRVSADGKIEENRRGHDWHFARRGRIADVVLFEPADDAGCRIEAERAAAGKDHGVHLVDEVQRIEQIGLACAGSPAALRHASRRAVAVDENGGAAGRPLGQGEMADPDAFDRSQGHVGRVRAALGRSRVDKRRQARREQHHVMRLTPVTHLLRHPELLAVRPTLYFLAARS